MIDPLRPPRHTQETQKTQPVKAESIAIPKNMKNISPSKLPEGVNLSSRTIGSVRGHTLSNNLFRTIHGSGAHALRSASTTPPESNDELDAIATLFRQKTTQQLSGPKTKNEIKGKQNLPFTASQTIAGLNPQHVEEARNRLLMR